MEADAGHSPFFVASAVHRFAAAAAATEPQGIDMKDGIHPNYREVCFMDLSNGFKFVTRSCANTKEMIKMEDGRELPLFKLDTSSESHPFYTGTQKSVDTMGGRVEKFRNRFARGAAAAAK
jgi:large subunit ribosomal protein L31